MLKKLQYEIRINAPVEKVWDTMLTDATYRDWTTAFNPGSYFKGDWSEGSKIYFIGPDPEGSTEEMGMVSKINENTKYKQVTIEHLGLYKSGVEDSESEEAKKWHAFESYTFSEVDGGTLVQVELDMDQDYAEMFNEMWPKALERLKELCETN